MIKLVLLSVLAAASITVAAETDDLRVVQMNLCNGGQDACYAGGQVLAEAAGLIQSLAPDVVTLNEVCRGDVDGVLRAALGDRTYAIFQPSVDRRTGVAFRCSTGDDYGVGVIGRLAAAEPVFTTGVLTSQDSGNEERGYACAAVPGDYTACTAHPTPGDKSVALAQCKQVAAAAQGTGAIVAGDLNLRTGGGATGVEACVPAGWSRAGDGAVQHVLAAPALTVAAVSTEALVHSDHDALVVDLGRASRLDRIMW